MGDLYPSSTQPESNSYSNEDFEKVEPGDLDQQPAESERDQLSDQVPTSTAFSGEEAEEDRYGTSEATQNLLSFGDEPVLEEPQSTTPSAPEVGEFPSLGQYSEPEPEAEAISQNPFSDPISSTTTTTPPNAYGLGEDDRDILQPDPISNLLTESTESKEWEGKSEGLAISGGRQPHKFGCYCLCKLCV